jgi:hypothetical protein
MMTNHMTRLGTWRWCHQSDYSPIFFFFGFALVAIATGAAVVVTAAVRSRRNGGLFFSVCTRPALVGSEREGEMKERNGLLQRGYVMRGQISSLIALEQQVYPQPQSLQKTKYNKQVREFLCVDCGWPAGDLSSHV